eukprot:scaffold10644_cov155-Skeletonema_dohrnii-CCMP3373.AAC.1
MVDDTQNDDESNNDESQLLFSCQCDSARTVADLLSCLRRVVTSNVSEFGGAGIGGGGHNSSTQRTSHTQSTAAAVAVAGGSANKIQHATVYAGPNGLTFHVQHGLAKQSQCSVDLPKGLFREYFVGEEEVWLEDSDVESVNNHITATGGTSSQSLGRTKEIIHGGEFGVNLTTVLECFSVLSRNNKSVQSMAKGKGSNGSSSGGTKQNYGEYASLDRVPLCMSYDRATALFHLEFLEGGQIGGSGDAANAMGGGCLVTCEVPGVAVSDDVDDGPDDEMDNHNSLSSNNTSGLAAAFRSSPLLSRAILYSDALQAAVAELYDVPGASVVQVTLSSEGMELGTVGPRSEVWVNVPYHKRQTGMYVGMECYKSNNNDPFGTQSSPAMIRKYPLGAFLTGMRGLDIGCETCISVNSRGMMAIQHQVAKDGYTDTSSANVRPSFVDFIMTCIEDEGDDEELSQENISQGVHQNDAWQNEMNDETEEATTTSTRNKSKTRTRETFSSSEDEEMQARTHRRKEKQQYDSASGTDNEGFERSSSNNAASKILGELELDKDMISSHRDDTMQGRKTALEDIRRRRRERQNESMRMDESDHEESAEDENAEKRNDYSNKRRSDSEPKATRKLRRSEGNDSESNQSDDNANNHLQNLRSTAQSSSEDDDDDDSEPEDALDVTAEIPKLFSKSPSMSTSRHGRRRGKSANRDDEAVDEEPKMMYGDTRLEFTQDGYESGDS